MRTFKKFGAGQGHLCPICKTDEEKETVLIPINGTQEGNIAEAEQFHLDCILLGYDKNLNIIYQHIK